MGYAGTAGINHLIADRFPWVCAVCLHLLLFAFLSDLAHRASEAFSVPDSISVEIVVEPLFQPDNRHPENSGYISPQRQSAALQSADAPPETSQDEASVAAPEGRDTAPNWVSATRLLAASVMADPRSAQARVALTSLIGADQREQLCALEAMEQVRATEAGFRPTRLTPHAFRNSYVKDGVLYAPAGAIRSRQVWYEITYRCRLDASGKSITGFEYALGAPIERALWDEMGLAPIH